MDAEHFAGLYSYLHGKDVFENKLTVACNAFLITSKVPPQQKEDVVISWIVQTLASSKKLNTKNQIEAWKTATKLIKSQRLASLCKNQWLCPISSEFIQTLHRNLLNKNTSEVIITSILEICQAIINIPSLFTRIRNETSFWLFLTSFMIGRISNGQFNENNVEFCITLIKETEEILKNNSDHAKQAIHVFEDYLMQYITLKIAVKDSKDKDINLVILQLHNLITSVLFHRSLLDSYSQSFNSIFCGTCNLSALVQKLFAFMIQCFESKSDEISHFVISEIFTGFVTKYKQQNTLHHQLSILIVHILGLDVTSIDSDDLIYLISSNKASLTSAKQEFLLCSLLSVMKDLSLDLTTEVCNISMQNWLECLGTTFMKSPPKSPEWYKCFQHMMSVSPMCMMNKMPELLSLVIVGEKSTDDMYEAYDSLMCYILNIYVKVRKYPKFFCDLINGLMLNKIALVGKQIVPTSFLSNENLLFPPKMMKSFNREIYLLPHRSALKLCTSLIHYISLEDVQLTKGSDEVNIKLVSIIVWLTTCCIGSSPFINMVSIEGIASRVADIMTIMGKKGIQSLINESLFSIPHNNDLCVSVLLLCHAWGEQHIILSNTDTGYTEFKDLPLLTSPSSDHPTDFSYLLPFINSDTWALLSARITNFGNQATKLALTQLVIQKLGVTRLLMKSDEKFEDVINNQSLIMSKSLLSSADNMNPQILELIVYHLPNIYSYIHEDYLTHLASSLLNSYRRKDKFTMKYLKSRYFREAASLHPYIISSLCQSVSQVLNASTNKKRKTPESDGEVDLLHTTCLKIFRKLWKNSILIADKENIKQDTSDLWSEINECGSLLAMMMTTHTDYERTIQSEDELLQLVRLVQCLPLTYLDKATQSVVIVINLTLLTWLLPSSSLKILSEVLYSLNGILTSTCHFKLFELVHVVKNFNVMHWILKQRFKFPLENIVNAFLMSEKKCINGGDISLETSFDLFFENMSLKYLLSDSLGENTRELGQFITSSSECTDEYMLCHIAAMYVAVCRKFSTRKNALGKSCRSIIRHIGTWMLRFFRTLPVEGISDSTTADILFIYTVLLEVYEYNHKVKMNNPEDADVTVTEDKLMATSEDTSEEKVHKWQKLVKLGVELSEIALKKSELATIALHFLTTAARNKNILKNHLPTGLLGMVRDKLLLPLAGVEISVCLGPLLSASSIQEYEDLLLYLMRRVQEEEKSYFRETMQLWQTIITGHVLGAHGKLKKDSLEHLIAIMCDKIKQLNKDVDEQGEIVLLYLKTIHAVLECDMHLSNEVRAMALSACILLNIGHLSTEMFIEVYKWLCSIVDSVFMRHKEVFATRVSLIMMSVEKLTLMLGCKGQDKALHDDVFRYTESCKDLERVAKEVKYFKKDVNKVCHFTVAKIIEDMEKYSGVYPVLNATIDNVIYALLDLCDTYALQHLFVVLPPASVTMLKRYCEHFKQYRQFNPYS